MTWVIYQDKAYKVVDIDDDGDDSSNDSLCLKAPPLLSFLNPFSEAEEIWVRRGDVECYYHDDIAFVLEDYRRLKKAEQ